MLQLLIAMFSTAALVIFGMANTHHVGFSYVVGEPTQVRLIVLLAAAFFAGNLCTLFWQLITRIRRNREIRNHERLIEARVEAELGSR